MDSPRLFEFVEELRTKQNTWVFPFSNAQEITSVLRAQLSFLMNSGLALRARFSSPDPIVSRLGPSALRIYVERPSGWEYLLLAQLLADEVEKYGDKRLDLDMSVSFGKAIPLKTAMDVLQYVERKMDDIRLTLSNLGSLINNGVKEALGPPGVPAHVERMVHVAARYGNAYDGLLEWTLEFRRVAVESQFQPLIDLTSEGTEVAISEMFDFAVGMTTRVSTALASANSDAPQTLSLSLELNVPENYSERIGDEMKRLKPHFQRP